MVGAEAEAKNNNWPVAISIVDGRVIGGVGVSGVTSEQDAQVANAGTAAMK